MFRISNAASIPVAAERAVEAQSGLRARLVEKIAEGAASTEIARLVNDLAAAEGRAQTLAQVSGMLGRGVSRPEIMAHLLTSLAQGSDDTYSGRTNDVRRAKADGAREVLADLAHALSDDAN